VNVGGGGVSVTGTVSSPGVEVDNVSGAEVAILVGVAGSAAVTTMMGCGGDATWGVVVAVAGAGVSVGWVTLASV